MSDTRTDLAEVKETYWGGGYKDGKNYCVDCHGWQGSVPDYFWLHDERSTVTVKCDSCSRVSGGVRRVGRGEADSQHARAGP